MTQVVVGQNENIESALRRLKRQVSKAGIFADIKRRRHYETPIEKRKRKAIARRKKRYRQADNNEYIQVSKMLFLLYVSS